MSKSLADLRAEPAESRPRDERSMKVCLRPHIVAQIQSLSDEWAALPAVEPTAEGDDSPVRKMGQGVEKHPREAEIRQEMSDLLDEMAEYEGELVVRATKTDGEWRRWCDTHPARTEGESGYDRDRAVAGGFCNADDLIDDLGTYASRWNGDDLGPTDWAKILSPQIGLPDKKEAAIAVVSMYEVGQDFPQWRSALSANLKRSSASASRSASASPTSDSTAGSPAPSSEATTETATA